MSGKRKRPEAGPQTPQQPEAVKPLSAIAAARLKSDAFAKRDPSPALAHESRQEMLNALSESPVTPDDSSDEQNEPIALKPNFKFCNWRNEPRDIVGETSLDLTVQLDKHSTIALVGCYQLAVLKGAVNINGANIAAASYAGHSAHQYTIFVPSTTPILKIRGLDNINHVKLSSNAVAAQLAHLNPAFSNIWAPEDAGHASPARSFSVIVDSESDPLSRPLSPERTPEDWLRAVEECSNGNSITCIVGASQSGKSTLAKRLLNRYLSGQGKAAKPLMAVGYLDLDPKQPEYTPHGQVSLLVVSHLNLGPNFTHAAAIPLSQDPSHNQVIRAHPIPLENSYYGAYYASCADDLFEAYQSLQSLHSAIPLIIDTPGTLYDSSFNTLQSLLSRIKPHNVIHMSDPRPATADGTSKYQALRAMAAQQHGTIHGTTGVFTGNPAPSFEVQSRAMQMQAFFHLQRQSPKVLGIPQWTPKAISGFTPWDFCYQNTHDRCQDFIGFALYSEPLEPGSLFQSLDGMLIQVVQVATGFVPRGTLSRTPKFRIPYFDRSHRSGMVDPLDPSSSTLVCTGLVRGFDPERNIVQVVFPNAFEHVIYSLVPERTVFVGGCCETPGWAYLEKVESAKLIDTSPSCTRKQSPEPNPWVELGPSIEAMGFLNTIRRVRKFQT